MKNIIIHILLLLGIVHSAAAQTEQPKGWFHASEAKLGEPILYSLVFYHTKELEVAFPDSAYDFSPFELLERQYFPTQSDSLGSYDSAVYTLATYELDSFQSLAIPALLPTGNTDADEFKKLFPTESTIRLVEVIIGDHGDKEPLEDTSMALVEEEFNFPLLYFGLGLLFVLVVGSYLLFGSSIRDYFKMKILQRAHLKFTIQFDKLLNEDSVHNIEQIILLWKNYTGQLMNAPIASYTTKEIAQFIQEKPVIDALKQADRVIYAKEEVKEIREQLVSLMEFTQKIFKEKIESKTPKQKN